jgi:hypothetical protein
MSTDISTPEKTRAIASQTPDDLDLSYEAQQSRVMVVAEMLTLGERSTSKIMERLKVSRPTAIKYRNSALTMIAEESKPMNREHLRNLEIGRLNHWIDKITEKINDLDWSVLDDDGRPVAFYMYDKLLQRLKDMGDQLHKITGLNTEVQVNVDEKRRVIFIRSQAALNVKDSGDPNHMSSNHNNNHVVEGEIIQSN